MTEAEWASCQNPMPMLEFLRTSRKASDRKLRLFGCACVRHIWRLLAENPSQWAIEVAEQFADGNATQQALLNAGSSVHAAADFYETATMDTAECCGEAAAYCLTKSDQESLLYSIRCASRAVELEALSTAWSSAVDLGESQAAETVLAVAKAAKSRELGAQTNVARDIFGPLLFCPVTIHSSVRTWNDGTVVKLAQAIYDERAFDRLPVLADALEDALCEDAEILAHCRQPGEHVRCCWVVDLLLGKS
jgi:hypothetical protein